MLRLVRSFRRRFRGLAQKGLRELLARSYLRGRGLEIGGLHNPLRVPRSARVTYVDRLGVAQLRQHYPELADQPLVPVQVQDDGERLGRFADRSQDFIIANHFLEHCQDPIGTMDHFFRVLRPGGTLYLAVPDKRFTFDRDRPVTPLEHLIRDHEEGPQWSRRQHFEEWTRLVNKVADPAAAEAEIDRLMAMDYSIHYHVWTQVEFLQFLGWMQRRQQFDMELFLRNGEELIVILRAAGDGQ